MDLNKMSELEGLFFCLLLLLTQQITDCSINLSLNKPARQSTTFTEPFVWDAGRAVDGRKSQVVGRGECSVTDFNLNLTEAWWQVDLLESSYVESVNILIREDDGILSRARMAGYSLYLSDSSDIRSGQLCYQHSGSELPPSDIFLTCNLIGRYLTIYVQRTGFEPITYSSDALLILCEVEAIGCPVGKFGTGNCNSTCSVNCLNNTLCDPNNGTCAGGCGAGWQGATCNTAIECDSGSYGRDCEMNCSSNCVNTTCDVTDGACTACTAGKKGYNCTEDCDPGFFGTSCLSVCPVNCFYQPCVSANGSCPFGKCHDGWIGGNCSEACASGYFGNNCIRKCGNCANDAICNHVTGNCPGLRPRCKEGWKGAQCLTECSDFTFGADCLQRCGRCLNASRCSPINGSCPFGCADGWEGQFCEMDQNAAANQHLGVEISGIIIGVIAGVFLLISCLVVIMVLRRKQYRGNLQGKIRRMKSSYVTFDEDNSSVLNRGSSHQKRQSRGDNLEIGYGREGTFRIADDHKRVSHYISDLYAVVDKPKFKTKDKLIIREPTNKTRTSYRITIEIPRFKHDVKDSSTADDISKGADGMSKSSDGISIAADDNNVYHEVEEIKRKTLFDEGIYHELADIETGTNPSANSDPDEPRQCTSRQSTSQQSTGTDLTVEVEEIARIKQLKKASGSFYLDMSSKKFSDTMIKLEDLKTVIYQKLADKKFDTEYQNLPEGDLHPNGVGMLADNKTKNRFAKVLPYDYTRVVLEPTQEDKSDYINASYIDGVNEPKAYIATQGPKKSTIRDFWRMIWQKEVGIVVMVTEFIEGGKVKCAKYWLAQGVNMKISNYIVTIEEEREYAFHTIRTFKIVNTEVKKARRIVHLHFTMWPDHGTPDPLQLALFQRQVTKETTKQTGPMVVHCSAGLGRTGTFIGLDALLQRGWKTGYVDIFEYVKQMRQNRLNMVQTADQYFIIHRALLEGFRLEDTTILKDSFKKTWEEMQSSDQPANRKRIRDEFQKLEFLRPDYDESMFTSAHFEENVHKNRTSNILPIDRYRPLLSAPVTGQNDYINAVMIPSFTKPVGYIVTQMPLQNTVVDIWRLLFDHNCATIISLAAINDAKQSSLVVPETPDTYNVGPFVIKHCCKKNISRDITEIDITVTNKGLNTDKDIKLYEVKTWKSEDHIPPNKELILSLAELTENERKRLSNGPILIMCPDGAIHSGLVCACFTEIERLEIDNEVDIFQTVRQLQIRRPEFIQKPETYSFCFDVIKEFLYPRNMYVNT